MARLCRAVRDGAGRERRAAFSVVDHDERERSITDDLCSICGMEPLRGRWFVGGAGSAFHPHGAYIDMDFMDANRR